MEHLKAQDRKMEALDMKLANSENSLSVLQSSTDRIESLLESASHEKRSSLGQHQNSFIRVSVIGETTVETSPSGSYATAGTEPAREPISLDTTVNGCVEHTTAAHRLLSWPSIAKLFTPKALQDYKLDDEYVMRLEEESGLLRPYGRGEGHNRREKSVSSNSDSSDGIWGSGFITPVISPSMSHVSNELSFEFSLNIHPLTLRRLLDSYLNNIHILHPFLDKNELIRMMKRFSERCNLTEQILNKSLFFTTGANGNVDALRDVHTNLNKIEKHHYHDGYLLDFVMFERSIQTAIVLLVMTMSRICEWKQPLPGVRTLNEQSTSNETEMHHLSSTRHNIQSPSSYKSCLRNVDLIPELSYYASATDILGNLHGSNDLRHTQAFLLAGLFMGQLARTFESFNWITSGCQRCRFLVRDSLLQAETEPRKNQIKCVFWTCSQLESDILVELDLPCSGIQELREVQYPTEFIEPDKNNRVWENSETQILAYYSGQIHIRNQLNDIQKNLYAPENIKRATRGFKLRDVLMENLTHWRLYQPPNIQWKEEEEPASHINAARLRAKFYGILYLIHRPFLQYALEHNIFLNTT